MWALQIHISLTYLSSWRLPSLPRLPQGAFEGINGVAFTCDQRLVLGADSRKAVRVWDVPTGRLRLSLTGHADKVMGLDCSPASPATVVSCSSDRTIKVGGGVCAAGAENGTRKPGLPSPTLRTPPRRFGGWRRATASAPS